MYIYIYTYIQIYPYMKYIFCIGQAQAGPSPGRGCLGGGPLVHRGAGHSSGLAHAKNMSGT